MTLPVLTFIVFVLLVLLLWWFAWGPIAASLKQREKAIFEQIEEVRRNAEQAQKLLEEHEARLAGAAEEARQMIDQAHQDAEHAKERILREAEEGTRRETERAVADIEAAKDAAVRDIARHGVDTAVDLASQIVRREMGAPDHTELIKQSLDRFPGNGNQK